MNISLLILELKSERKNPGNVRISRRVFEALEQEASSLTTFFGVPRDTSDQIHGLKIEIIEPMNDKPGFATVEVY